MTPFLFRIKVPESQPMNYHAASSLAPSALIAVCASLLFSGSRLHEFKGPFYL